MAEWKDAVARLYNKKERIKDNYCGTAFMVSDRFLLTCFHVVRSLEADDVFLYDVPSFAGGVRRVRNIFPQEEYDVALLELREPTNGRDLVPLAQGTLPVFKDKEVECAGYSSVESDRDFLRGTAGHYRGEKNLYAISKPVGKGMSGGPVLRQGYLVGISRLQDDKKTYFIPYGDFKELLAAHLNFGNFSKSGGNSRKQC